MFFTLAGLILARIKKIRVDKKNPAGLDPARVIFYLKFAGLDPDQNPGLGRAPTPDLAHCRPLRCVLENTTKILQEIK
jgi:hypothetical protein